MSNVLFARLNRKHCHFLFYCQHSNMLWKNVEQYYLTITNEFHGLCLREVIIGIKISLYQFLKPRRSFFKNVINEIITKKTNITTNNFTLMLETSSTRKCRRTIKHKQLQVNHISR